MMEGKLLLTPEEAARALSISRARIFEMIRSGEVESVKIGKSRRISPAHLQRFIERLGTDNRG